MCPGIGLLTDGPGMPGHGVSVATGHDQPGALAPGRADGPEGICPFGPLVVRRAGPRPPPRPASREFVLLTGPGLVLKPDPCRLAATSGADVDDGVADVFPNAPMAPSSCAQCCGRAESTANPMARGSRPGV